VRISLGSDHAGFDLKQHLVAFLQAQGHEIVDCGTRAVVRGEADFGIVMGGSGQGEQLAANKVKGVRAALCNDLYLARMARSHNDANVLSIGGRIVGIGLAEEIVSIFLTTEFEGGRHQRRVDQVMAIENE
jgi:ribose 5-phosphate isomerase B